MPVRCPGCGKSLAKKGGGIGSLVIGVIFIGICWAVTDHKSDVASPAPASPNVAVTPTTAAAEPSTPTTESNAAAVNLAPVVNHDIHPANAPLPAEAASEPSAKSTGESTVDSAQNTASAPTVAPADRTFTDDEIDRMEDAKQYHGDDPIVRARLGLPSRETKRLAPSN